MRYVGHKQSLSGRGVLIIRGPIPPKFRALLWALPARTDARARHWTQMLSALLHARCTCLHDCDEIGFGISSEDLFAFGASDPG